MDGAADGEGGEGGLHLHAKDGADGVAAKDGLNGADATQEHDDNDDKGSLCVLDWVSEGRRARGESWDFRSYRSLNEVWALSGPGSGRGGAKTGKMEEEKEEKQKEEKQKEEKKKEEKQKEEKQKEAKQKEEKKKEAKKKKKLLLRDNVVLDKTGVPGAGAASGANLRGRMDGLGVFGTLILRGAVFEGLADFFVREFAAMPRVGGRRWDGGEAEAEGRGEVLVWREERLRREGADGLVWTAAAVRGFVVVKFGAREVEGAKSWLLDMLKAEGSVEREFGERALLCLK